MVGTHRRPSLASPVHSGYAKWVHDQGRRARVIRTSLLNRLRGSRGRRWVIAPCRGAGRSDRTGRDARSRDDGRDRCVVERCYDHASPVPRRIAPTGGAGGKPGAPVARRRLRPDLPTRSQHADDDLRARPHGDAGPCDLHADPHPLGRSWYVVSLPESTHGLSKSPRTTFPSRSLDQSNLISVALACRAALVTPPGDRIDPFN